MLEGYKIVTITHRNTHLEEIGKYVIQDAEGEVLQAKLAALKAQFGLEDLMYLSTCNRVMYFFYTEKKLDKNFNFRFFQAINPSLTPNDLFLLDKKISAHDGEEALNHLYEVAASVDSLVVGEREILRQLRQAYKQCHDWGIAGDKMRLAMQSAVSGAKKVYANTRIGEKPVSVVSLAIKQMMNADLPENARILMIGAGQTNELVAKFLSKYHFQNVHIYNRTLEKAEQIAHFLKGTAHKLEHLEDYKSGFDCMIVCTGATHAIVDMDLYEKLLNGETDKKVVIDLSIPYNVDKAVFEKHETTHIEIEGLRQLAQENLSFREKEVTKAKEILKENILEFNTLFKERELALAMKRVPTEIKAIKAHAMENVFKKDLDKLDSASRALVEEMLTYMEKKCISIPMKAAKEAILK